MVPMTGNKLSVSPEAMERMPRRRTRRWASRRRTSRTKFGISREDQDEFALASQKKAAAARREEEVRAGDRPGARRPLQRQRAEDVRVQASTSCPRPTRRSRGSRRSSRRSRAKGVGHGRQQLAALRRRGRGARDERATRRRRSASSRSAYFRAFATVGVDPAIMGIGPVPAMRKLLAKTGLRSRTSTCSR